MNRIYRLVWSRTFLQWVAVSEFTAARGKSRKTPGRAAQGPSRLASWSLGLSLSLPTLVFAAAPSHNPTLAVPATLTAPHAVASAALPTGGKITSGSGQISQNGAVLTITQQSQNLALNWQTFNIGTQATVDFIQPGARAIAVNRIADANGSEIFGHLHANGQVFLINPNGVLFGQGAQVNVGGLVASTLDVDDNSLGSGRLSFSGNGHGSVINQGTITAAPGGYVALLGNQVGNQGLIHAQLGSVALAGGSAVTLSLNGDSLVDVKVDQSTLNALAQNGQLIQADGGQVWMTAGARDSLLASVVNNTGTVEAQTVGSHNGTITLLAGMQAGTASVGGKLDASAPSGGHGGAIETSAGTVRIANDAMVTTHALQGQSGHWLIDPNDFTIAASGGDMTGAQLSMNLAGGNVTIESSTGANSGSGNINVNDAVNWSANTLTLTAANNININAVMTAGGTAGLALNPATANGVDAAASGGVINAMPGSGRVDFTGSGNTLSINNSRYTLVSSAAELQSIGNFGNYALANDMDAGDISNFSPLGQTSFRGNLEGLGHTISHLNIDADSLSGLFVYMNGTVADLGLIEGKVTATGSTSGVGELAAVNSGVIRNVYATGTVTATGDGSLLGGLVAYNSGTISNAYAAVTVTGSGNYAMAGGLVAVNDGANANLAALIQNAYATGAVTVGTMGLAGGLVELNQGGRIQNTYATGAVRSPYAAGGLVDQNTSGGTISLGYWDTQTSGLSTSAGGTGLTTAQFQAGLPSGFLPSSWGLVAGKSYPYLMSQFAPGATPQVISGTVYTDNGSTPAGAGVTVGGAINGNSFSSQTGSNGYYYFLLAPNTVSSGEGVLVYAHGYGPGNGLNGATFLDSYSGNGFPALNIDGGLLGIQTPSSTWSGVLNDLAVAEGGGATAATALGNPDIGSLDNLSVTAAGNFTIDNNISAGNLSLNAQGNLALNAPILANGTLQIFTTGGITQSASLDVIGDTSISASSVVLANAGNQFTGKVALSTLNAQLSSHGALNLGALNVFDALAVNSSGALDLGSGYVGSLSATSGSGVTQSGALVGTQATITAGTTITLDNINNAFGGAVSLFNSGNNNVVFNNSGALQLGTVTVGGGALTLSGNGMSQTGAITQSTGAGATTFNGGAGNIILDNPSNDLTGTVSLSTHGVSATLVNGGNPLLLGDVDASNATLDLQAGNITQSNGTAVTVDTLTGSSTGSVSLVNANAISTLGNFASDGSFSLYDGQALTVGGTVTSNGNPLALETLAGDLTINGALTTTGNTLQLISAGNISCESTCAINAETLTGSAVGSASISGGIDSIHVNELGSFTSGDFFLSDDVPLLTMSGVQATSSTIALNPTGEIADSATVQTNYLFFVAGLGIAINGDMNVSGNIDLETSGHSASITQTAPIMASGATNLFSRTITLTNADNVWGGPVTAQGVNIQLSSSGPLNLNDIGASGSVAITSSGPVIGSVQAGQLSISAGDNPITINTVGNGVTGTVNLSNSGDNDVLFDNGTTALQLGAISVGSGTLTLSGNGISQTGVITQSANAGAASFNGGTGAITLGSQSNDLTGVVSLAGTNATVVNGAHPLMLGDIDVGSGTLGVSASTIAQASGTTITAGSLTGTAFDTLTLPNANSVASLGAFTANGFTFHDATALTISGAVQGLSGNTLITSAGDLTLGSQSTLAGKNVTLVSGGVFTNQAGANPLVANDGIWQVWSQRSASDSLGNLAFDFKQYDATYGSTPLLGSGNGVFYTEAPTIQISLGGSASKTYDGSNSAPTMGLSFGIRGVEAGDRYAFNYSSGASATFDDANAGADKRVTASGWTIYLWTLANGIQAPVYGYQVNTTASNTIGTIVPAPLTVTANAANKIYDGLAYSGGNGVSYYGFVNGETPAVLAGALSYGGDAQGAVNAGNYSILPGGLTAGNYNITFASGPLSVTPASLTVAAYDASKVYDGLAYAGGNGVRYNGFVDGENATALGGTLSYSGDGQGAVNVGSYTLMPGGLVSGNYNITFVPGQLSVTPASLFVTANNVNTVYDGLAYAGGNGVSYSGFVNGETPSMLSGTLNYGGDAQGAIDAGSYSIMPGGLTSGNYSIAYVPGQLAVTPAPLTVSANNAAKVYDGLAYTGNNGVSYSGFVNGETPSMLSGTLNYGGDAQGAINAGSYSIMPGGLTSGNYSIAYVPGQLTVTPAPLTVSVNAVNRIYDAQAYSGGNGVSYAGFVDGQNASVLGGSLAYGGGAQGALNTGSYVLTANGLVSSNYAISYVPSLLTITPAVLTYVASPEHLYSGEPPQGLTGTIDGFQGDDTLANSTTGTLTWNTPATAQSKAGQYAIIGGGLDARNYIFNESPANQTALTIGLNNFPATVGRAAARLQQQLGLIAPVAAASTSSESLQTAAVWTPAIPSTDVSDHAAQPLVAAPYAPDLRIVDGGMRLP